VHSLVLRMSFLLSTSCTRCVVAKNACVRAWRSNAFGPFVLQNSQARLNTVIGASIGGATAIYLVVGLLGYFTFGSKVGSLVTLACS
jgi:hypothetical protein